MTILIILGGPLFWTHQLTVVAACDFYRIVDTALEIVLGCKACIEAAEAPRPEFSDIGQACASALGTCSVLDTETGVP